MNRDVTYQRRWMAKDPAISALIQLLIAGFAAALFLAGTAKGPAPLGNRAAVALSAVGAYWALALAKNKRVATVTPAEVSVKLTPFPLGNGHRVPRALIGRAYLLRHPATPGHDETFSMGVETLTGRHIEVNRNYSTAAEALIDATEIAELLDLRPEIETLSRSNSAAPLLRPLALWAVISLLALVLALL